MSNIDWKARAEKAEAEREQLKTCMAGVLEALSFYANPDTWFATTLLCDRPCGEIEGDYSSTEGWEDVASERLGKRAREALTPMLDKTISQITGAGAEALATPHAAAGTVVQEHYFVDPRVALTLTPEEIAVEKAKFYEAAKNAVPMNLEALDAQLRPAPATPIERRTPLDMFGRTQDESDDDNWAEPSDMGAQ